MDPAWTHAQGIMMTAGEGVARLAPDIDANWAARKVVQVRNRALPGVGVNVVGGEEHGVVGIMPTVMMKGNRRGVGVRRARSSARDVGSVAVACPLYCDAAVTVRGHVDCTVLVPVPNGALISRNWFGTVSLERAACAKV